MPIELSASTLIARELLSVEEAETVLEWLIQHPHGQLDLADCTHVHAASLQVLLAARPTIAAWPRHDALADWLQAALLPEEHGTHV